jgi:hypothetical protein
MDNDANSDQVVTGQEDVNSGQVVTDQTGVGQPATGDDVAQVTTEGQDAEGQAVPYDRFKEVNDAKKAAEEQAQQLHQQNQAMAEQMRLMQANAQPTTPQKDLYTQVCDELGIDDEIITREQQAKIFAKMQERTQAAQVQSQFVSQHPDFNEVVGIVGAAGLQPSEPLKRALQKDPTLARQIQTPFGAQAAYRAAKVEQLLMQREQAQSQTTNAQEELNEQVRNAERVGSASSVGGSGQINRQSQILNMSKEEFDAYDEQVRAGKAR